jgi:hypothetical protein
VGSSDVKVTITAVIAHAIANVSTSRLHFLRPVFDAPVADLLLFIIDTDPRL